MVSLTMVFYWLLCFFAIHAPGVPGGSTMRALLGPSGIPVQEFSVLVFLGMNDHVHGRQCLRETVGRSHRVWAFLHRVENSRHSGGMNLEVCGLKGLAWAFVPWVGISGCR
jgi:hypothetical protein